MFIDDNGIKGKVILDDSLSEYNVGDYIALIKYEHTYSVAPDDNSIYLASTIVFLYGFVILLDGIFNFYKYKRA